MTRSRPSLVHSIDVAASAEEAWRAITDPEMIRLYFFGYRVRSEWTRGARIVYELPDGTVHMSGRIVDIRPGRGFTMSVRVLRDADTAADLPSRITWEIRPTATGCRITVIHDDFAGTTPSYQAVQRGWPSVMHGLEELLETGDAAATRTRWPEFLIEMFKG